MPEIARIGTAFTRRRVALRLTQQALADPAGVSRSTVHALEYGSRSVRFGTVTQIAEVLGLTLHPTAGTRPAP